MRSDAQVDAVTAAHRGATGGPRRPESTLQAARSEAAASLRYLVGRLSLVEARVRRLVSNRRAGDPEPDDPVRGLYISEDHVDRLLAGAEPMVPLERRGEMEALERWGDAAEERGTGLRLRRLARSFALDPTDVEILLVAMAPDLDPRFERLYGYLNDDVTRRRACVGLTFELLGMPHDAADARRRFASTSPLVARGLMEVLDGDRPFLTRSLHVPDRVTSYLLGDDEPPERVARLLVDVPVVEVEGCREIGRCIVDGLRLVYVRQTPRTAGSAAAVAGLSEAGWGALAVDPARTPSDEGWEVLADALREAAFRSVGLVAGPIDELVEADPSGLDAIATTPVPVVLVGRRAWDPTWTREPPASISAGPLSPTARSRLWADLVPASVAFDADKATVQFRLKPEQVVRAWHAAQRQATATGREVTDDDLRAGARLQNAGRLDHLARRITPSADFTDLVLPPRVMRLLQEIVERARFRERVLDDWHMGGRSEKGRGITSLFAGESGTGKTLSAEVVAHELGLDLYVIDLSTVVDKYIGETEKNLERIFDQAEDVNGVLFFDEADALFGKRSEVSDARDRYANVEIAYLLQRMEHFDGITVLATNLRANLDEAFTRRIDVLIDFPEPEEEDRRRLWELHLPDTLPRDDDLDLGFLAKAFELSGGDIRNVTLAAAYAAAVDGGRVTAGHLVRATAREYRKLGRLVTESEFGPWFDRVSVPTPSKEEHDV